MARVASFEFFEDPVAHTNASTCNINWAASTVAWPGVINLPFAVLNNTQLDIDALATQNLADGEADTQRVVYNGTVVGLTINCAIDAVAGVVNTISPGGSAFPKTKAQDLALGIRTYILASI